MSLTNEQRAHDLALLAVEAEVNRKLISQINGADYNADEKEVDIYGLYYDFFHRSLDAFNLDFPKE
ncbi:hypothetical protein Q3F32_04795 [Enterococcus faecium]|uniref:hypothetical protein n=1 Tax=Enterococcus TaxID=1350 RepID=UPI0002A35261|nr:MULTISPECIES: hypothetical protein [Enterococcus]MDQ8399162.1 hypothetical protein [Enterococcus faecium]ELA70659.1 hypothetical protein OGO_01315 [Enterococcus faecium EnGen0015]MDQ8409658.1 hypothetical protein [Enterococcus faecium]MDQ8433303.1 hypothetical protein [Enterococcus faecium]HAP6104068.1 hypothetical protein [Enterococcus faecium]